MGYIGQDEDTTLEELWPLDEPGNPAEPRIPATPVPATPERQPQPA